MRLSPVEVSGRPDRNAEPRVVPARRVPGGVSEHCISNLSLRLAASRDAWAFTVVYGPLHEAFTHEKPAPCTLARPQSTGLAHAISCAQHRGRRGLDRG